MGKNEQYSTYFSQRRKPVSICVYWIISYLDVHQRAVRSSANSHTYMYKVNEIYSGPCNAPHFYLISAFTFDGNEDQLGLTLTWVNNYFAYRAHEPKAQDCDIL